MTNANINPKQPSTNTPPEVLVITSYPPRECGIATYSHDLVKSLCKKYGDSLSVKICALESEKMGYTYPPEVKFTLNTSDAGEFPKIAAAINSTNSIVTVLVQHEFGLYRQQESAFIQLLEKITKPIMIVFHSVLPSPNEALKAMLMKIVNTCNSVVVMTNKSKELLTKEYGVQPHKIYVIPHGTHLVEHIDKDTLKRKYGLEGRKVISTFGLLSSGKNLETTLDALPAIIQVQPEVIFLIIGKTHPEVVKSQGESYRDFLKAKVTEYNLENHVRFVNSYLALSELLEYLQLSDIYVFSSSDPNQAVSGTFAYAMSCGCPIISTPIPHAKEVLSRNTGIIFDFGNSVQLANSVLRLLNNEWLLANMRINSLQKIVSTAWENSAEAHALLLSKIVNGKFTLKYHLPDLNLNHLKRLTTTFGIIQFAKVNQPMLNSGYTLDDNARALVAMCMHYEQTQNKDDLLYIKTYLEFIGYCQRPNGRFLSYVNRDKNFTVQNQSTNLDEANGHAIWALGYLISKKDLLPPELTLLAQTIFTRAIPLLKALQSDRALAFALAGLYLYHKSSKNQNIKQLATNLADRLMAMYKQESGKKWCWFESSITYSDSILPEAMLYAWLLVGDIQYKIIAQQSLHFLLTSFFNEDRANDTSNRAWIRKEQVMEPRIKHPIDVAHTVMTLSAFFEAFRDKKYLHSRDAAFSWYLGNNSLKQTVYNPCTGGCYDGLDDNDINLNQGAESTVSYLLARLTADKGKEANAPKGRLVLSYKNRKYTPHQIISSSLSQRRIGR